MLEEIIRQLLNSPATILFLVGLALVILGLVRKIPIKGGITVPPDSRKKARDVGMVFVIGSIVWMIATPQYGPLPPPTETPTPTDEEITKTKPTSTELVTTQPPTTSQVFEITFTPTQDPEDAIRGVVENYFTLLNNEDYREAWDYLTSTFREDQEGDFPGYEEFWATTVKEVQIVKFRSPYVRDDEGEIVAILNYYKKEPHEDALNKEYRFCLLYNEVQRRWLINHQKTLDKDC